MLNTQLADLGLPVGCYWQSSHPLKWRIAMLKHPSPGPGRLLLGASLALIGCSVSAFSAWAAQPPRIEQVAPAAPAEPSQSAAPAALAAPAPAASILPDPAPRAPRPHATARPSIAPAPAAPARPAVAPAARAAPAPAAPETPRPIDVSAPLGAFAGESELAFVAQDITLAAGLAPLNAAVVSDVGERDSRSSEGVIEFTPPRLVESTPPRYPYVGRLARRHEEGVVVLRVDLDAHGSLLSAAVEQSDLPRRFNNQALAAVKHWRFEAALKNGVPVTSTALVPVVFGESESQEGSVLLANGSPVERYRTDSRRINSAIRSDRHGQVH
jgi:TonB family protein